MATEGDSFRNVLVKHQNSQKNSFLENVKQSNLPEIFDKTWRLYTRVYNQCSYVGNKIVPRLVFEKLREQTVERFHWTIDRKLHFHKSS